MLIVQYENGLLVIMLKIKKLYKIHRIFEKITILNVAWGCTYIGFTIIFFLHLYTKVVIEVNFKNLYVYIILKHFLN